MNQFGWCLAGVVAASVTGCGADPGASPSASSEEVSAADLRFRGAGDFDGTYTRRASDATTGGQSSYVGVISTLNLPRPEVERLLPAELRLAPPKDPSLAVHPVLILFGTQANGTTLSFGFPVPTLISYRELIVLVPFVQRRGSTRWHSYATRMYLDFEPAKILGEDYGYKKELAWLEWLDPNTFAVRDGTVTGQAVLTGHADAVGSMTSDGDASVRFRNYRALKDIFEMPIVGQRSDLSFACSYFEFDYARTNVLPVSVGVEFHRALTPQMGSVWTQPGPRKAVEGGAFYVDRIRWRLAWPAISCAF